MAFTKILGPGIHTLANFHSHNINSSGIITATKFVGDMEPGGGTGTFDSLTVTGNLGVGGTVTYTDVTNVDAIGIITAQSGIHIGAGATVGSFNTTTGISSFKTLNVDETSTLNGSVGIADSIIHIGNTDTSIRFPSDDTFTIETAGSEALRIDSTGRLLLNTTTEGNPNADDFTISFNNTGVSGGDQGRCGMSIRSGNNTSGVTQPGYIYFSDGTSGDNESKGAIAYDHNVDDMYLATDGVERLRIGSTGISTFLKDLHVAQSGTGSTVFINSTTHNTSVASIAMLKLGYTHSGGQAVGYLKLEEGGGNSFDGNLTVGVPYNQGSGNFATRDALTVKFSGDVDLYGATAGVTSCFWDASANSLIFNDDVKAAFGNGSDFTLQHNSDHAIVKNTTGRIYVLSDDVWFKNEADNKISARFFEGNEVYLYHNDTARLTTTSTGITVGGEVAASQDYPNFRPTLDFNFAAEKKLDPRITYQRTGPASFTDEFGKVVLVGGNVPRFDHDPTTRECKGLLIEESRTNLFASSDAGHSAWILNGGITRTANTTDTKDPAGTYTACKLMSAASANSGSQIYDGISHGSGGVQSLWAKKGTHNVLGIFDYGGGSGIRGWFDLNTGEHRCEGGTKVAAGVQSNGNDTNNTNMIEYPNGWYRCIYYENANMTYAHFRIVDFDSDNEASASSNSIYVWGLQAEGSGSTYATSHIPCNTGFMPGTISRGGDIAYLDGTAGTEFDDIYRSDEGTFIIDWFNNPDGNHNDGYVFTVDDGTGNNRIAAVNSNNYQVTVTSGGSSQGTRDLGSINSGANKIAFTYKHNDQATSLNGSDASVDTSSALPTGVKYMWFGLRQGQYDFLGGYISRIVYYTKRLPNNQLKTLSS